MVPTPMTPASSTLPSIPVSTFKLSAPDFAAAEVVAAVAAAEPLLAATLVAAIPVAVPRMVARVGSGA